MSKAAGGIEIRRAEGRDTQRVIEILQGTQFFRPGEIKIAREVLEAAVKDGPAGDYQSYVAQEDGDVVGWVCFGATPCTVGTFDVYWVGVDAAKQGRGIGKAMMEYVEAIIRSLKGRMIVVETSGTEHYKPTQRFYEKLGYGEAARVKEFYAPGDDKVIYIKRV
jgi:ribosomal protein S18 acetylase RimI-like enzyme